MEITVIYKQAGSFWTAAAFIGGALAGSATCTDKVQAGEQARSFALELASRGPLQELSADAARLGGSAKVSSFSMVLAKRSPWPLASVQAAQLAALDITEPLAAMQTR